jgi:phage recombination protein Bet
MAEGQVASRPQSTAIAIEPPRLPYHPGIQERFGIGQTEWRALVESTFPSAKSTGAVILALAYCKARGLDPFKKTVHIVPIWDKEKHCYVETVWPGIAEYRTTAARTGLYAGHDEVQHGDFVTKTWTEEDTEITVTFPEWAQMTAYRIVGGQRVPFPGPRVYWLETYAEKKSGAPNSMWADRPIGMLDKCAEAAALRGAFPEELGGEASYEEYGGFRWHGRDAIDGKVSPLEIEGPKQSRTETLTKKLKAAKEPEVQPKSEPEAAATPQPQTEQPATASVEPPKEPPPETAFEPAAWADGFIENIPNCVRAKVKRDMQDQLEEKKEALGEQQYLRCFNAMKAASWIV